MCCFQMSSKIRVKLYFNIIGCFYSGVLVRFLEGCRHVIAVVIYMSSIS